ncbi:MAG: TolC family protein [Ignavibacteriaceae bacterium]|nr:TolC family protein [Ignavibacteriaceae bacterium]
MIFRANRLIWIFFLGSLITISGYAQDVKKLSVDESVQIGLENSHTLHSSNEKVKNAQARVSELRTNLLPSLKFNGLYTRLSPIEPFILSVPGLGTFNLASNIVNNYSAKLTLQQPLFTGFKLLSSVDMADYNSQAQKQDYTKDEHDLIYNIKYAYWSLYKAIQLKAVVDENVNQIKAHLEDVTNMFNQGMSTKNDVLKVQVQLGDTQIKQIDANNNVRLSMINLDNVMGLPLSTNVEPVEKVNPKVESLGNIDIYIDKAYQYRPELKGMDFRIKASESGVTLAKSGWWPQLFLVGDYLSARPNQRIFPTTDSFKETWDVSLSVSWDIWTWGATAHQTDQAQTQVEQAKDSYKILKDGITLEVTQNYLNIMQAKEKMTVASNNVSQAEENYRVTDEKFKNGLTLNSELLDAEVALLTAKTNLVQSQVDYELAKAQLEKSSGDSSLK